MGTEIDSIKIANKMNKIDDCGIWETFIPGLSNYQSYKFHFLNAKGNINLLVVAGKLKLIKFNISS